MSFSLYDITVPAWRQTLNAALGWVGKAEAFCAERGLAPAALLQERLADDMFPLAFQFHSVCTHSLGAWQAVQDGLFAPSRASLPADFDAVREKLQATLQAVEALQPAQLNALMGRDMVFRRGDAETPFVAEDFLLSFSQPNFYFHAATAYGILRASGVPLGKADYLGALRKKA